MPFILLVCVCTCQTKKEDTAEFYFSAEWEDQESVWLGWSVDTSIQKIHLEMAKALSPHVALTIAFVFSRD